jgi:hypothetical protein
MIYHCCDLRRRERVLEAIDDGVDINGIDYIEVLDREAPDPALRQRTLLLRFLTTAPDLIPEQFELSGGERVTGVAIEWVSRADAPDEPPVEAALALYLATLPDPEQLLVLRTDSSGDYASYRLRLVAAQGALQPPSAIDRVLSLVDFSFKVECPTDFDCDPCQACPEPPVATPPLSYLAKDYQSFRRLMLGRMAQIMPDWRERNPADLGITLVELLAYTADRLSYAQDAVATEAYLATARRRSSVRRHARLVDYRMHDGANARVWVQLHTTADDVTVTAGTQMLTRLAGLEAAITNPDEQQRALQREPLVFEALHDQTLFVDHSDIPFYEWSDVECCLPRGATRATLARDLPNLVVGDVLIFEQRLGPRSGRAADADPGLRHAVRLCAVEAGLSDTLTGEAITEIRWAAEDALPFPVCLSSRLDDSAGGGTVTGVSVAQGNVLLADHGRTLFPEGLDPEDLGRVPEPHLQQVAENGCDPCQRPDPVPVLVRYRPVLAERPVSQAAPHDQNVASAFAALRPPADQRRPSVQLTSGKAPDTLNWHAQPDLLRSSNLDRHFVIESEQDGSARLRFGDHHHGRAPNAGTPFVARYRVGNGTVGNVGHDAIQHILTGDARISAVRNPLPAIGGAEPESMEAVRQAAPYAYRRQQRAVTADDYAEVARRHPDVQRAAATFRWNGHGHTVFVTVDRFGGRPITNEFEEQLIGFLDGFRMAGYDLEVDAPRFAALEIDLFVCAHPDHFRSRVRHQVLREMGTSIQPDGSRGLFHPDALTFGQPVYLSAIYSRVMAVEGVSSVRATVFRRRGRPNPTPLADGVIEFGRTEIAQLDNDPNFPERGAIQINMGGGK